MGWMSGSTKAPAGQTPVEDRAAQESPPAPMARSAPARILAPELGALDRAQSLPMRPAPDPSLSRHGIKMRELVDRLVGDVVLHHTPGRRVLDLGHGADTVTSWVSTRAGSLRVIDAVDLGHGSQVRLPFADGAFDLVYSLRTLPHLGHDEHTSEQAARSVLAEIGRVLALRGTALVQIDNPRSLWGAYHGIRNPMTAIERPLLVDSDRGLTRFDTLSRFSSLLPETLTMINYHGVRVMLTLPHLLSVPIVGRWIERLEWYARDRAPFRAFGAHLLVVLRRS
jgi:SAM-dependent methyltransferase